MSWVDNHAAAIQALAALASVGLTVALALITQSYVRLTRELVATTREQLDFIKAEHQASVHERRRRLESLIQHLRRIATSFPTNREEGEQIRNVVLWRDDDPDELRRLAATFDLGSAELASEAAQHLATLAELARVVQATHVHIGVRWDHFNLGRWNQAMQGCERCLQSLSSHLARTYPA
jgi:hypothetical protein